MIAITFDMEWSTDLVLNNLFELLDFYSIPSTIFATHRYNIPNIHECGIHPNFLKGDGKSEQETIEDLIQVFPEAIGLRSHSLYIHSQLREDYAAQGIQYESNYMMYRVSDLEPFMMGSDVVQMPIYFMDDLWFRNRNDPSELPSAASLLNESGLKIFDFHPPHIIFNTPSLEFYEQHKELYYNEAADIDSIRYDGFGVRTLFIELLDYIKSNDKETTTLSSLAKKQKQ